MRVDQEALKSGCVEPWRYLCKPLSSGGYRYRGSRREAVGAESQVPDDQWVLPCWSATARSGTEAWGTCAIGYPLPLVLSRLPNNADHFLGAREGGAYSQSWWSLQDDHLLCDWGLLLYRWDLRQCSIASAPRLDDTAAQCF